jgi:hypothetical protein
MAHRLDWLFGFCIALSDSRFQEAEAMNKNEIPNRDRGEKAPLAVLGHSRPGHVR